MFALLCSFIINHQQTRLLTLNLQSASYCCSPTIALSPLNYIFYRPSIRRTSALHLSTQDLPACYYQPTSEPSDGIHHGKSKRHIASRPRGCGPQHTWSWCNPPAFAQQAWIRCWKHHVTLPLAIRTLARSAICISSSTQLLTVSLPCIFCVHHVPDF